MKQIEQFDDEGCGWCVVMGSQVCSGLWSYIWDLWAKLEPAVD